MAAGARARNVLLLLASLFFYAWGGLYYTWILIFCIMAAYVFGRFIERAAGAKNKKWIFACGVICNLLPLLIFKYAGFLANTINRALEWFGAAPMGHVPALPLPIGISFYVFQSMSYLFDVYRGSCPAQKNPLKLGLYVSMFPQLIAGPIVRYPQIARALDHRRLSLDGWDEGIRRFVLGLGKKLLIADTLGRVADQIMVLPPHELGAAVSWLGIACFTLQIYYDFSGYSDMAIGLGLLLGFRLPENFNYPYASQSVREFWRSWHITLSTWFRDYVYFPLGGNRGGTIQTFRNLIVVFALCGIWHGASWNFLIWGLFHGFFLGLERTPFSRVLNASPKAVRSVYTLVVVMVGWVFFRISGFMRAVGFIGSMFGAHGIGSRFHPVAMYVNNEILLMGIIAVLGSFPLIPKLSGADILGNRTWALRTVSFAATIVVFSFSILYVAGGTYNPFIYFRF